MRMFCLHERYGAYAAYLDLLVGVVGVLAHELDVTLAVGALDAPSR